MTQRDDPEPFAQRGLAAANGGSVKSRRLGQICVGAYTWDLAVLRAIDKMEVLPRDTDGRVLPLLLIVSSMRD